MWRLTAWITHEAKNAIDLRIVGAIGVHLLCSQCAGRHLLQIHAARFFQESTDTDHLSCGVLWVFPESFRVDSNPLPNTLNLCDWIARIVADGPHNFLIE